MKAIKSKTIVIILGAAILSLPGCTGSDDYYNDASLSRETAYNQWKGRKERNDKAQPIISGQLSLQDCIKLTLVNNKTLQRVAQDREIARGQEMGSYSAMLPTVGISAGYVRQDKVQSIGPFTLGDVDNYSMKLRVDQPIFAGGAIIAKMNAARLFRLMTDQTVRATTQDVLYAAEHAYYDVMLNKHLLEISNDAVRSSQVHLDNVKQKRVELSNFQADLLKNKNAIDIARTNLLKVMGVSQDSDIVIIDEFVYESSDMKREEAVQVAFKNRPDLFSREFGIKYAKETLNISKSRYLPVVGAYYEMGRTKPDPHNPMLIDWGNIWSAGGAVTLPLFDGFGREGDVIAQKARLKQAQIDLIDSEETAIFEITKAILSIEDAAEFVDSQKLNLTRAKEGLRLAEVGYKEGTNTQVEMIDAQSALTQAKVNYYQSIYTHNVAKLDLQKAMGTLAVPVKD
jgi:outer membrane protein TolC